MAAPTVIQNFAETPSVTPMVFTISGVAAGSTLLVAIAFGGGNRTFSISDDRSNTWTMVQEEYGTSFKYVILGYAENVSAGDTEVTISVNVSTATPALVQVYELSACEMDAQSTHEESGSNQAVGYGGAVGEIDTAADVFVIGQGAMNATANPTAGSGFTSDASDGVNIIQTRTSSSALTDERAPWDNGTSRKYRGIVNSFAVAGGGSTPVTVTAGTGASESAGIAPSVAIGESIAGTSGASESGGGSPAASVGISIAAMTGTSGSAGVSPDSPVGVGITPPAGGSDAAGISPVVGVGHSLEVASGSSGCTGVAPSLTIGQQVIAGAGASESGGSSPDVLTGQIVSPAVGSSDSSGASPSLSIGQRITAGSGSSETAGVVPSPSIGGAVAISAGTGSSETAGVSPSIPIGVSVIAETGQSDAIGGTPLLSLGIQIAMETGSSESAGVVPSTSVPGGNSGRDARQLFDFPLFDRDQLFLGS